MKILFVASALDLPEAWLVRGLIERGLDVRLLIDKAAESPPVLDHYRHRIDQIVLRNRIDIRAMRQIRSVIKSFSPDIIHSLSAKALSNSIFASWRTPIKHVAYRGTMGNLSYWDPSSLISFLHPRLSKIICVSDAVRNDLERLGLPSEKLVRIYKGHDPEWYRIAHPVSRTDLGIPAEHTVISCVANSRPVKGIDTLIRAFRLIPADRKIDLVLVGEVRDGSLQKLAEGDRRIHFLGYRHDAPAIVAGSDLFCMPSRRREGFPKALIEAMIQGIPAVVTSVGGLPEMVIDGENGLVVEPENHEQLGKALEELVSDRGRLKLFGERAKERVLREFRIGDTIEATAAIYGQL